MDKIAKTEDQWREELAPDQYAVLRQQATEPPFTGRYVDTKEPGVYRCAGCQAELFRSDDKFDSGSGWPSFTDAGRRRRRRAADRHVPRDGPHGGRVRALRRAPGARLRRRPAGQGRHAVLHQLLRPDAGQRRGAVVPSGAPRDPVTWCSALEHIDRHRGGVPPSACRAVILAARNRRRSARLAMPATRAVVTCTCHLLTPVRECRPTRRAHDGRTRAIAASPNAHRMTRRDRRRWLGRPLRRSSANDDQ